MCKFHTLYAGIFLLSENIFLWITPKNNTAQVKQYASNYF